VGSGLALAVTADGCAAGLLWSRFLREDAARGWACGLVCRVTRLATWAVRSGIEGSKHFFSEEDKRHERSAERRSTWIVQGKRQVQKFKRPPRQVKLFAVIEDRFDLDPRVLLHAFRL